MGGFTLIELIIVIVILGILAVTAAPRFIDIATDANIAKLNSLKGSVEAGTEFVFAKSVLQGVHTQLNSSVDIDGDGTADINTHSGYPGVMSNCNQYVEELQYWLDINLPTSCTSSTAVSEDWTGIAAGWRFYFVPKGFTDQTENCYLLYTEARQTGGGLPERTADDVGLTIESSGC
jgi:MSHA pilin protein MshA